MLPNSLRCHLVLMPMLRLIIVVNLWKGCRMLRRGGAAYRRRRRAGAGAGRVDCTSPTVAALGAATPAAATAHLRRRRHRRTIPRPYCNTLSTTFIQWYTFSRDKDLWNVSSRTMRRTSCDVLSSFISGSIQRHFNLQITKNNCSVSC